MAPGARRARSQRVAVMSPTKSLSSITGRARECAPIHVGDGERGAEDRSVCLFGLDDVNVTVVRARHEVHGNRARG